MHVSVLNNDTDSLEFKYHRINIFSLQVYTSDITESMNVETSSVIRTGQFFCVLHVHLI
jgi:hypothetical protein